MKLTSILITALVGKSLGLQETRAVEGQNVSICTNFFIPVTVSAANFVLPLSDPPAYQQITGTYKIGARYCEPHNIIKSRHNTLQILVHGITYTRNCKSRVVYISTQTDNQQTGRAMASLEDLRFLSVRHMLVPPTVGLTTLPRKATQLCRLIVLAMVCLIVSGLFP